MEIFDAMHVPKNDIFSSPPSRVEEQMDRRSSDIASGNGSLSPIESTL